MADANGKPRATPHATGTLSVGTTAGWYRATFAKPVILSTESVYFLSWDQGQSNTRSISEPIAQIGVNSTHFERNLNQGWSSSIHRVRWAYRVLCTSSRMTPRLASKADPFVGNTRFSIDLSNAIANAPAVLLIGASNKSWNAIQLPLDLAPLGAKDCRLFTSIDLLSSIVADAGGNASLAVPIPNSNALKGVTFYVQWSIIDRFANNLGLSFANAAKIVIGEEE